jgi:uncharacterized protein YkwD
MADTQVQDLDLDVCYYQNLMRTNPAYFYDYMNDRIDSFVGNGIPNGCGENCTMNTNEGPAAVEEALEVLKDMARASPLEEMAWDDALWFATYDHCQDTGYNGLIGHTGNDGSDFSQRMHRYGVTEGGSAENISYGNSDAMEIVMQLFIDDGVASRGHRTNMVGNFREVAVSTCCHESY